jgi:hypothetical protein
MGISFGGSNHNARHPRWTDLPLPVGLDVGDPRRLDICGPNAAALFALLGFPFTPAGEVPIAAVRTSILRANLRFAAVAAEHARAPVEQLRPMIELGPHGSADVLAALVPSVRLTVAWEVEPVVFHVGGLTETGIARSLGALVTLLDALEELGATHLRWG